MAIADERFVTRLAQTPDPTAAISSPSVGYRVLVRAALLRWWVSLCPPPLFVKAHTPRRAHAPAGATWAADIQVSQSNETAISSRFKMRVLVLPGLGHVTATITFFVSLEMAPGHALRRLGPLTTIWQRASVTVAGMERVIYASVEFRGTVKPRASANEDRPVEPFGSGVPGRSTVIRSDELVPVRTVGSRTYVDADLSLCSGSACRESASGNCCQH
jgi:hypothetical protein